MENAKAFISAFNELEIKTGVSKDAILSALKEALDKGLKKQLGGDDAYTLVNIDMENGFVELAQLKKVVEVEEDDFLEISLEEARQTYPDIQIGDFYKIDIPLSSILKTYAITIKNVFQQKLTEAEKAALYETYKDKIGEMITGTVDKVEEKGLQVTIAKTSIFVPRRELIKDERFYPKDPIKLYVSSVSDNGGKGTKISVSRANEGFLKRVFEEEIHEIYDGTIIIKGIARKAGERSKVAVYSNDPNVDPAGACIGPNGVRIQKVVAQLGNSSNKEKVDVIGYSDNAGLFVMESLKPAVVLGIVIDKENKKATAIIADGSSSVAYGKRFVNLNLAKELTGYDISLIEESVAKEENLEYQTYEELERLDIELRQKAAQELLDKQYLEKQQEQSISNVYVAPDQRHYEEEMSEEERETLEEEVEKEELEVSSTPEVEKTTPEVEEVEEPTIEVVKEEVIKTDVKTTTTLADLEKELESEAKKAKATTSKAKKKVKKEEAEDNIITHKVDPSQRMSIYTEEELKAIEEEEQELYEDEYDDDEIDYNDYDEYYDDEN